MFSGNLRAVPFRVRLLESGNVLLEFRAGPLGAASWQPNGLFCDVLYRI